MTLTIAVNIPLPTLEETLDYDKLRTLKNNFESFLETSVADVFDGFNVSFIGITSSGISTHCQDGYVLTQQKTTCSKSVLSPFSHECKILLIGVL